MSVRDLMPEGFTEEMAHYARISRGVRVVPQGIIAGRTYAVWLEVEGGGSVMIGHGDSVSAISEAQAVLRALSDSIQRDMADLIRAQTRT